MTLNDLEWPFCAKICPALVIQWVDVFWLSDTLLFGNLQNYAYTVRSKNVARGLPVIWSYTVLGSPEEGASNRITVFTALTRCHVVT